MGYVVFGMVNPDSKNVSNDNNANFIAATRGRNLHSLLDS
jgi:hypothetical protein